MLSDRCTTAHGSDEDLDYDFMAKVSSNFELSVCVSFEDVFLFIYIFKDFDFILIISSLWFIHILYLQNWHKINLSGMEPLKGILFKGGSVKGVPF